MATNPRLRESPPRLESSDSRHVSDAAASYKTPAAKDERKATELENAGREPRQEIARQPESRDSAYTTRSHKSIPRRSWGELPDSPIRTDSREQMHHVLDSTEGQSHE